MFGVGRVYILVAYTSIFHDVKYMYEQIMQNELVPIVSNCSFNS